MRVEQEPVSIETTVWRCSAGFGARGPLLRWLNEGLRPGVESRLEGEYGEIFASDDAGHVVLTVDGRFACHVLFQLRDAHAGSVRWRVGTIGLVYTDPKFRGRGFGALCVERALDEIALRGGVFALLWSELDDFYQRKGFRAVGRESFARLEGSALALLESRPRGDRFVRSWQLRDSDTVEMLYRQHESRVDRTRGHWASLAGAPESWSVVAEREGVVVAYASCGRGDDFRGVIHEWGGELEGVMDCVARLVRESAARIVMLGPKSAGLKRIVEQAGFSCWDQPFAWVRLLDASAAVQAVSTASSGQGGPNLRWDAQAARLHVEEERVSMDEFALVRWLLEDGTGSRAALGVAGVDAPLYLWGFDSI